MSLECSTSPTLSNTVERKLKCKNAAKLYRFGSPKLRDVLREKCRSRIKEARQNSFAEGRFMGDCNNSRVSLQEILRNELSELESDIKLQEEIYKELVDNLNDWFAEQLEDEEKYLLEVVTNDYIICPLCELLNLVVYSTNTEKFNYRCKCNANFVSHMDCQSLRTNLYEKIEIHEGNCTQQLNFFVNPLNQQLEALCDKCDYLCSF